MGTADWNASAARVAPFLPIPATPEIVSMPLPSPNSGRTAAASTSRQRKYHSLRGKVNSLSGKGFVSKIASMYHSVGRMLMSSFEEGGQGVH